MFGKLFSKNPHQANEDIIIKTLHEFGIEVVIDQVIVGYQVKKFIGIITNEKSAHDVELLNRELQLELAAHSLLVYADDSDNKKFSIVTGQKNKETFYFSKAINEFSQENSKPLTIPLGATVSRQIYSMDFSSISSVVVAGCTGSGKSMLFHTMINGLVTQNGPDDLQLVLIDPKRVELTLYHESKYLWAPVEVSSPKAVDLLNDVLLEADRRISDKKIHPHLVIVIDEFSDLMHFEPVEVKNVILEIFRKAKLAGMSMVIGTSRPSDNVYPKEMISAADVVAVGMLASNQDSMHLIDKPDGEMLVGSGDMLVRHKATEIEDRIQVCYISEEEILAKVKNGKN